MKAGSVKNGLLAAVSFFLALTLVEVVLRTGIIQNPVFERTRTEGSQRPSKKILLLGDSFLHKSMGIHPRLISQLMQWNDQVMNLATGGVGPFEYRDALKYHGSSYHPDIILLGYYAGNDLTDTTHALKGKNRFKEGLLSILKRLYLYDVFQGLKFFISDYFFDFKKLAQGRRCSPWIALARERKINYYLMERSKANPDYFNDNLLMNGSENEQTWRQITVVLSEIKKMSDSMHARLAIVIFPEALQVSRSHESFYKQIGFRIDEKILGTSEPQERLARFCKDHHIDCLDLLPDFRGQKEELYFENDIHLNAKGQAVAAERMLDFLMQIKQISRTAGGDK